MKKTNLSILCILMVLLILSSCVNTLGESEKSFSSNYLLGIIETTEQVNKSYIGLYNDSLKLVREIPFEFGSMGSPFHPPQIVNDKMYVVPQGIGNQQELTMILEFDCITGKSREIEIGLHSVNSFFVNERYIFSSSTINGDTVISRTAMDSGENKKTVVQNGMFVVQMLMIKNRLYVFGIHKDANGPFSIMSVFDMETMNLVDEQNISKWGISHHSALYAGNSIYFTSFTKPSNQNGELPDNRLIKYDLMTNQFSEFILKEQFPSTMVEAKGKLYILHSDLVTGVSHGVSIFDLATETHEYRQLKEEHIQQISMKGETMCALSDSVLYKYKTEDNAFILTDQKNIHGRTGKWPYYYVSGMFIH